MTDDRIEGTFKQGLGHVQDAVGGLTGDTGTQARGKINEVSGSAQEALGQARQRIDGVVSDLEDYAKREPLTALAATLGVGLVLGLALRGGRKPIYIRK